MTNWDSIKGQWSEFSGKIRSNWVKLTNEDLEAINGKRDVLIGKLESRYGFAKAKAETELNAFMSTVVMHPPKTHNQAPSHK